MSKLNLCVSCMGYSNDVDENNICERCRENRVLEDERFISEYLVSAWNKFVSLEQTHPCDIEDFKRGIHDLQKVMGMRELRRLMPEKYPCK